MELMGIRETTHPGSATQDLDTKPFLAVNKPSSNSTQVYLRVG